MVETFDWIYLVDSVVLLCWFDWVVIDFYCLFNVFV